MVIINSNEDKLIPIDMPWLSSLIFDRTIARQIAGIRNRITPSHHIPDNAPGTWSYILPTPLTAEMSKQVLGPSGHGYCSHALNK
eukprot:4694892-Heterocapsa_arctica.AAC.1